MADAADVAAGLPRGTRTKFIGLTLNRRGFDRAVEARLDEANFVVVASDTFNRKNQGVATEDSIAAFGACPVSAVNEAEEAMAISASSSAFGSITSPQSANTTGR